VAGEAVRRLYIVVSAVAFGLVFAASGIRKSLDGAELRSALNSHATLPEPLNDAIASTLGPTEVIAGLCAMPSLIVPRLGPPAALVIITLLTSFVAYLGVVLLVGRTTGSCGCGVGADVPIATALTRGTGLLVVASVWFTATLGPRARPFV